MLLLTLNVKRKLLLAIFPTVCVASTLTCTALWYKAIIPYSGYHDTNGDGNKEFVQIIRNTDYLKPWICTSYTLYVRDSLIPNNLFNSNTYGEQLYFFYLNLKKL